MSLFDAATVIVWYDFYGLCVLADQDGMWQNSVKPSVPLLEQNE